MTRMRVLLIALLAGATLMVAAPVANAAPGDCLILAGQPVCEPFPDETPPLYSVCTDLPPAEGSTLIRRSCQLFRVTDDVAVGDPQVYTYPPANTLTPPPSPSPSPAVTPTRTPAAPSTRTVVVSSPSPVTRTLPAAPETVVETVEVPAPTTPPTTTSAAPTTDVEAAPPWDGITSDEDRENWFMSVSDGMLLGIAAVAALVLLTALVVPPWYRRRRGAHRA